ncbi:MAG: prolipoprotein diacylglyceryl transferase family protein [Eubacteriales bacterium]
MGEKLIFIAIGTAAMLVLSLLRRKKYQLELWKAIVTPFVLTFFGVIGTLLMFFIETGRWGGISFYGSVFMIPVGLLLYSLIIKEKYTSILDFSVTQICAMLASMKILCLKSGCCYGAILFDGFRFPSQIAEMSASLCIMALFLYFEKKEKYRGIYYPLYLVIYGTVRFVLNFFRGGLSPLVWILPAGHFWSIVAIIIGIMWLLLEQINEEKTSDN